MKNLFLTLTAALMCAALFSCNNSNQNERNRYNDDTTTIRTPPPPTQMDTGMNDTATVPLDTASHPQNIERSTQ